MTPQGSITIALNEELPTMEMWQAYNSYGYPILRNIEEGLVNRNAEATSSSASWPPSGRPTNPTTWRFTLRQGVKFHDGSPFNAEAAAVQPELTWSKENNFRIRTFIGPELRRQPSTS